MKSYVMGKIDGLEGLELIERDIPAPGPGEILLKVKANAVNYRDLSSILNAKSRGIAYPRVPNSDGAGIVEATGTGVTKFTAGDRVVGCFFQNWIDGPITADIVPTALGGPIDGMLSEYVILKEQGALPIPDYMSFEEASTLPCAALTAWNCLIESGGAVAGQTALLLGTGGVSVFALQMAAASGIKTIMTSSSDEKLERVKSMGATHTVNYKTHPDWEKEVQTLTNGAGVDVVIEVGGAGTLAKSVEAVKIGGHISLVGILAGGTMDPTSIMRKSVCLQGIYVGPQKMFARMNAALSHNKIRPVIDEVVDFDNAVDAYKLMQSGRHFGKIVIAFP